MRAFRVIVVKKNRPIRASSYIHHRTNELRQDLTPAEVALWEHLRARRLGGFKFRRQHPLGPFIVDFYCAAQRLIIELDGGIHETQIEQDEASTAHIESYGYRILRFWNDEVEGNIEIVLSKIIEMCEEKKD